MSDQGGSQDQRPVPDPTALTTEQLHREIAALREFVLGEIRHVGEVNVERFSAVQAQFQALDERTKEQKTDTQEAVRSALTSARELVALRADASERAIAKSELSVAKQIEALAIVLDTSSKAKDEKIEDLKARITRVEGRSEGSQTSIGMIIGAVGGLAAVVSIVIIIANVLTGSG